MNRTIIGIFCYKRAGKLKVCVEALLKNPECSSLDIIFFSDGYKGEHDRDGVLQTRNYIDNLTGFRNIYKEYRTTNLNASLNFHAGLTYLTNNYDRFIVVEDDLVVTPNFVKYLLDGLDFYQHEATVFCLTGFCFPLKLKNYSFDSIIAYRFNSYGWASWSNRLRNVVFDKEGLVKIQSTSPGLKKKLNGEGLDLYRMLNKQINGLISAWDIQMQVHIALNNLKVVYPVISKVSNIGFDSDSTHTSGINYLKTPQDTGTNRKFSFCDAKAINKSLLKQLQKPHRFSALAKRKIINSVILFQKKILVKSV